jgi:hypothetical protein
MELIFQPKRKKKKKKKKKKRGKYKLFTYIQLGLGLRETRVISTINQKDNTTNFREIISPQSTSLLMAT